MAKKKPRKNHSSTQTCPLFWHFPDSGTERGINDDGIESFTSNFFASIARETIQNSMDAHDGSDKCVRVEFTRLDFPSKELPDLEGIKTALTNVSQYWQESKKAKKIVEKALQTLKKQPVPCLQVADFNTTGLEGNDARYSGSFYKLIHVEGDSDKDDGGGSWGIGQKAPFAGSNLRTVLYSTKTNEGVRFTGVIRLASHMHEEKLKDLVGTLSLSRSSKQTTDDPKLIPSNLLRHQQGTTLTIVGCKDQENWIEDLTCSVLEYFWPAIHDGQLEVKVAGSKITKKTLDKIFDTWTKKNKEVANAYHMYQAYIAPTHHVPKRLPSLKKVDLYLRTSQNKLPKLVAMVRKTGMVIYTQPFHSPAQMFCGIFVCKNKDGNKTLREMEPPKHNKWDPNRPTKNANNHVRKEINNFIREQIGALSKSEYSESIELPELDDLLPDIDDDQKEPGKLQEQRDVFPTTPRTTNRREISVTQKTIRSAGVIGQEDSEDELQTDNKNRKPGKTKGTGGSKKPPPSRSSTVNGRGFPIDRNYKKYQLILRSKNNKSNDISFALKSIGDDGGTSLLIIESAVQQAGAKESTLKKNKSGSIGPIQVPPRKAVLVDITLSEPVKAALEVIIYAHQ